MKNAYVKLARWLLVVLGSMLAGGGLVLHAQVAVAHYLRHEVASTFFLWRGIGRLTFSLQSDVTQTAFALDDIPPDVLTEADRTAWVLVIIGAVVVMLANLIRVRRKPAKKPLR